MPQIADPLDPAFADAHRRVLTADLIGDAADGSFVIMTAADREQLAAHDAAIAALAYPGMHITDFEASPLIVERGAKVDVTLVWTLNRAPTAQTVNGAALDIAARGNLYHGVTATTSYTLAVTDAAAPAGTAAPTSDSATQTVSVLPRRYWGVSAAPALDAAGVLALQSSELSAARAKSFTVDGGTGAGLYAYYAYPASEGAPSSYALLGYPDDPAQTTVHVTTLAATSDRPGNAEDYIILRSPYPLTGSILAEIQ